MESEIQPSSILVKDSAVPIGLTQSTELADPQQIVKKAVNKKQGNHEQQDQQSNQLVPALKIQQERRYGNYIKFIDKPFLTIMLGPDYLCFLPTFIVFSLFAYLLIRYINQNVQNQYVIVITYIICVGQCLSYLLVAISDPGIAHPLKQEEKLKQDRMGFCRRCRFDVPHKSFHCTYCDVCIMNYDHHCPWTSKCIGKNNLIKFYIFLFMTPIFIVYSAFAFGFTFDPAKQNHNLQKGQH